MRFVFEMGDVIRIWHYHHVVDRADPARMFWVTACGRFSSFIHFEEGVCEKDPGHPTCLWCAAKSYEITPALCMHVSAE